LASTTTVRSLVARAKGDEGTPTDDASLRDLWALESCVPAIMRSNWLLHLKINI